jgi:hypothetical protein
MQPEKQIENDILRFLWSRDIYCWKVKSVGTWDEKRGRFRKPSPFYKKGVSDIIGLLPCGKLLAIEVKSEKGRLRPEQKLFLNEITQRKGLAFVARSISDVKTHMGEYLNEGMLVTSVSEPT